ncbi:MAG: ArdC-like ssDNA-binding domain-containing protein [Candidatus Methylumidiphilus sp.]
MDSIPVNLTMASSQAHIRKCISLMEEPMTQYQERDYYREISNSIMAQYESTNAIAWRANPRPIQPINAKTGHRLDGFNSLNLANMERIQLNGDPRFFSHHDLESMGMRVKKGEKALAKYSVTEVEITNRSSPHPVTRLRPTPIYHASQLQNPPPYQHQVKPWQTDAGVANISRAPFPACPQGRDARLHNVALDMSKVLVAAETRRPPAPSTLTAADMEIIHQNKRGFQYAADLARKTADQILCHDPDYKIEFTRINKEIKANREQLAAKLTEEQRMVAAVEMLAKKPQIFKSLPIEERKTIATLAETFANDDKNKNDMNARKAMDNLDNLRKEYRVANMPPPEPSKSAGMGMRM